MKINLDERYFIDVGPNEFRYFSFLLKKKTLTRGETVMKRNFSINNTVLNVKVFDCHKEFMIACGFDAHSVPFLRYYCKRHI